MIFLPGYKQKELTCSFAWIYCQFCEYGNHWNISILTIKFLFLSLYKHILKNTLTVNIWPLYSFRCIVLWVSFVEIFSLIHLKYLYKIYINWILIFYLLCHQLYGACIQSILIILFSYVYLLKGIIYYKIFTNYF